MRVANDEIRDRMGHESMNVVTWKGRLRWFGHVERMGDGKWVKRVRSMSIEGVFDSGKPKRTWAEVIHEDVD